MKTILNMYEQSSARYSLLLTLQSMNTYIQFKNLHFKILKKTLLHVHTRAEQV